MVSRTNKFRGSRYHGRGKKAGRGAGKRGGRGNAGINKHRLMTRLKYMPGHLGMFGFNRHPSLRSINVSINVQEVQNLTDGDSIDLGEAGYDKLLGKGRIDRAVHITVAEASARAIEKVEAAGGSVSIGDDDDDRSEWEEE
jgi:large subunit ribosomal protein L15